MKKLMLTVTVFGLVVVGPACTPPGDYAAREAAEATVAADEAMKQLVMAWDDAMTAGEVESAVALYAEDEAVAMPPDMPAAAGAEGLRGFFAEMFAGGGLAVVNQHDRVLASGDLVIARGNYRRTLVVESGEETDEIGKWTCIARRKDDGSLDVVRNIWNRDLPPVGAIQPLPLAEMGPEAAEDAECLQSPQDVDMAFVENWRAGNVAALVANHSETGSRMAPGLPALDGRDRIAAYLQTYADAFSERELELTETGQVVEGELGYTWGRYSIAYTPADGSEMVEGAGKYVAVSQRGDDGCWRYEWVIWNGDSPWPEAGA